MSRAIVNTLVRQQTQAVSQGLIAGLSTAFPLEIPNYILQFKVVDSDNNTKETMQFPINPTDVQESRPYPIQVQKMHIGTSVTFNPNYQPISINLRGTFARNFKIIPGRLLNEIRSESQEVVEDIRRVRNAQSEGLPVQGLPFAFREFKKRRTPDSPTPELSSIVKSGYGTLNLFKRMCDYTTSVSDTGQPFFLQYINPFSGTRAFVVCNNFNISMSDQRNRIWYYNVNLTTIADIRIGRGRNNFMDTLEDAQESAGQTAANVLVDGTAQSLLNGISAG